MSFPSTPPASPEWIPLVNVTLEDIPGGAVVEPAGGYDSRGRVRVRKCTADDSYGIYFNGPMGIPAASLGDPDEKKPGGLGRAAWPLAAAAVHPDDLAGYAARTPAGTKAGDWYLRTAQRGFLFLDALADGTANVMPVPPANTGGQTDMADGGVVESLLYAGNSTGYPEASAIFGGAALPQITDTFDIRIGNNGVPWFGNQYVAVLYVARFSLTVAAPPGAVADNQRGRFVVTAEGPASGAFWDLGNVVWPTRLSASDGGAMLCGSMAKIGTEGFFSDGVTPTLAKSQSIVYRVSYRAPANYTPTTPQIKFAVCTTALVIGNAGPQFQNWLDRSNRGTSPQASCPSMATVLAVDGV